MFLDHLQKQCTLLLKGFRKQFFRHSGRVLKRLTYGIGQGLDTRFAISLDRYYRNLEPLL